MVPVPVPVVQETDALVFGDRVQEPADLGITVDRHLFRKEWMGECEIRIILPGVLFINDQVCNKVQDQSGIFTEAFRQHRDQFILVHHLPDDDAGTNLETAAPVSERELFRDLGIRKIDQELIVREHKGRVICRYLPDDRSQRDSVALVLIVFAAVLIQDIGRPALSLGDDLALDLRDFYCGIEVHSSSYI